MSKRFYFAASGAGFLAFSTVVAAANPSPGDIARGKVVFARCAACHATSATAPKKLGPHLQNLNGRKAGSVVGFKYSPAMVKSNIRWNDATLDRFLQKPSSVVPANTMAFVGLPNAADRKALLAYLKKPN